MCTGIYCWWQIHSARSVVSGDISLMPIFVGVRWWGDVKWECGHRKCEFSLRSQNLLYEVPHWLDISKFTQLRAVSRRQHGCCQHCQYSGRREVSFELLNATICPQAWLLWCSDVAIENASWGRKIGGKWGRNGRILTLNELDLTFWVPNYCAKFHQN